MFDWIRKIINSDSYEEDVQIDSKLKKYMPLWVSIIEIFDLVYAMESNITYSHTGAGCVLFDLITSKPEYINDLIHMMWALTDDNSFKMNAHELIGGIRIDIFHESILHTGEI